MRALQWAGSVREMAWPCDVLESLRSSMCREGASGTGCWLTAWWRGYRSGCVGVCGRDSQVNCWASPHLTSMAALPTGRDPAELIDCTQSLDLPLPSPKEKSIARDLAVDLHRKTLVCRDQRSSGQRTHVPWFPSDCSRGNEAVVGNGARRQRRWRRARQPGVLLGDYCCADRQGECVRRRSAS
jgi:hypothetical protein